VDDLFIQPAFRRAGLGTAALTEVLIFCAKRGGCAMFVEPGRDNAAAQALYRRVGWMHTYRQLLATILADSTHVD